MALWGSVPVIPKSFSYQMPSVCSEKGAYFFFLPVSPCELSLDLKFTLGSFLPCNCQHLSAPWAKLSLQLHHSKSMVFELVGPVLPLVKPCLFCSFALVAGSY